MKIFSKRCKQAKGKPPDVYEYDTLPEPFRVQVVHILNRMFGSYDGEYRVTSKQANWFGVIHQVLASEYGVFKLDQNSSHVHEAILNFILRAETKHVLDAIEISFHAAKKIGSHQLKQAIEMSRPEETLLFIPVENALTELNDRFQEHGIGYQYETGQIIKINSQFVHKEITKSALDLLQDYSFAGAQTEFLNAHKRYRAQQYEDAIGDSLKAFESTLKIICSQKKWSYDEKDTAKQLVERVFEQGLIPDYLQSEFSSLRSTLESGVPTIRNRKSGHGRGNEPRHIPQYLARYVLHLTASTIVFLVSASKE